MYNGLKNQIECGAGWGMEVLLSAVGCDAPDHCNEVRSKCLDEPAFCHPRDEQDKEQNAYRALELVGNTEME
jgi:hypothetical protein